MSFRLIFLFQLSTFLSAFSLTLEVPVNKTLCFSEHFPKFEPVSIQVDLIRPKKIKKRSTGKITVEFNNTKIIAERPLNVDQLTTVLTFNNDSENELSICLKNTRRRKSIIAKINVKASEVFQGEDVFPQLYQFNSMDQLAVDIYDEMLNKHLKMIELEGRIQEVILVGNSFENKVTWFSFSTVLLLGIIGFCATRIVKTEIRKRKGY